MGKGIPVVEMFLIMRVKVDLMAEWFSWCVDGMGCGTEKSHFG